MKWLVTQSFAVAFAIAMLLGYNSGPLHSNQQHGNNPGSASQTLNLLTYVYLLAPDLYSGYTEVAESPLVECIEGAILACGVGEVCSVCVVNHEVCSFICRNEDGSCTSPPPCMRAPDPDPDIG